MAARVNLESSGMAGTLAVDHGGTGETTLAALLSVLVGLGAMNLAADQTVTGIKTFNSALNSFTGSGSGLTALNASNISSGTLNIARIADEAVATTKLADGAVTTAKLADGAVTAVKITDATITNAKLVDSTIATGKIADSAITTAKINDGAVTAGKIASDAVTAAKMADASVELNTATVTGILPIAKGGTGANTDTATNGQILTFDGVSNTWLPADAPGDSITAVDGDDVTIEAVQTGSEVVLNVKDGGIDTTQLADSAVTNAKLATSSLTVTAGTSLTGGGAVSLGSSTTIGVSNGGITDTQLASDSVIAAKIQNGAVTDAKLATGAVVLSTGTVTGTLPIGKGGTGLTSIGTALQILRTNSTPDGLEWADMAYTGAQETIDSDTGDPYTKVVASGPTDGDVQDEEVRLLVVELITKLVNLGLITV